MTELKRYPTKAFDCWGMAKELREDIYRKLAQKASGEKNWLVASGGTEGLIGLPAGLGMTMFLLVVSPMVLLPELWEDLRK